MMSTLLEQTIEYAQSGWLMLLGTFLVTIPQTFG
jgi:hypothetical protein